MHDIWKAIIEHVLSWPVAVLVLGFTFNKPLRNLIDRVDLVKGPGIEVSSPITSATKQLNSEETTKSSELAVPVQDQLALHLPEDIEGRRRAVLSYGGEEPLLLVQMKDIEDNLEALQFPLNSEETTRLLIRHLAVTQLLNRAEQLYRMIFGSQITLMRELNEVGPRPEEAVRLVYERARAESPAFYSDYSFENWIKFVLTQQAVAYEDGKYGISVWGRQFLSWLVVTAVPPKPF